VRLVVGFYTFFLKRRSGPEYKHSVGGIEGKKEKEAKRKKETQQETVNIVTSVVYIPHKNQHP